MNDDCLSFAFYNIPIYIIPFFLHLNNAITFASRMIIIDRLTCSCRGQPTSNQNIRRIENQKLVLPPPGTLLDPVLWLNAPPKTVIIICNLQSAICNVIHACNILSIWIKCLGQPKQLSCLVSGPAMSVDLSVTPFKVPRFRFHTSYTFLSAVSITIHMHPFFCLLFFLPVLNNSGNSLDFNKTKIHYGRRYRMVQGGCQTEERLGD